MLRKEISCGDGFIFVVIKIQALRFLNEKKLLILRNVIGQFSLEWHFAWTIMFAIIICIPLFMNIVIT
jgi:hypothetical protein